MSGNSFNEQSLLSIGDHLSEVFLSTGGEGRGQSQVSGGGYGWEGLICWYLNLCLAKSRGVAIKKISNLPEPIREAISVNYGSFKSNTESDITVIIFPDLPEFKNDKSLNNIFDSSGKRIENFKKKGQFNSSKVLNRLAEIHFDLFEVGIIQCKTNWNDNAQIPMLWNMIYQATFSNSPISIGRSGYSIQQIPFSYSFCTVPSNKDEYKTTSTSVQRVRSLSGGNYWGKDSQSGISNSIKEIFNRNYQSAYGSSNQRTVLKTVVEDLSGDLNYFNLI